MIECTQSSEVVQVFENFVLDKLQECVPSYTPFVTHRRGNGNPNGASKQKFPWYDADCRRARQALRALSRRYGP